MARITLSAHGLAVLWLALPAMAASFDCARAGTPQEKAICADSQLSKQDEEIAAAYKTLSAQLSPGAAAELQQDQRAWLDWLRQVCPEREDQHADITGCLKIKYAERLYTLRSGLQRVAGLTFFPRLRVMVVPDRTPPIPNTSDPGFGVGEFSWPEIDKPTPQQAAWNAAVRQEVVAAAAGPDRGGSPAVDFEAARVAGADISVVYHLKAANERLISVTVENETYGYGAAHPNEFAIAFHWWLPAGRPLQVADVFVPGGGWEDFLAQRCFQKLTTGEHKDDLYEEAAVRRAVADSIKPSSNWILDSQKLEIDFPEYSVAPRLAGFPSVELTWDELKPYLAPGFDPAVLPRPLAVQ